MGRVLWIFMVIASAFAYAEISSLTHSYNLEGIHKVLAGVRGIEEVPLFDGLDSPFEIEVPSESPDPDLLDLFRGIQFEIFGSSDLIDLKVCHDCELLAEYSLKTVFYESKFVQRIQETPEFENSNSVVRYVFTHEIAHFLHEISAHPPFSHERFKSVSGLPSAYGPAVEEPDIEAAISAWWSGLTADEQSALFQGDIEEALIELFSVNVEDGIKAHAEVDIYTALILMRQGFDGWEDVFKFIDLEIEEVRKDSQTQENQDLTILDLSNRKRVIQEILKRQ